MRGLITCQVIISLFSVVLVSYLYGKGFAYSLGLGTVVASANLILLGWSWQRIFSKKTVALAAGVIVFKYAILGLIIYLIVKDQRISVGWFVGGFSSVLPAVLIYALIRHRTTV